MLEQRTIGPEGIQNIPQILSGHEISRLPERFIVAYGEYVSDALKTHPYTMLQYTPEELIASMQSGTSIVALAPDMRLAGFAHLWRIDPNSYEKPRLEFGSWLSFNRHAAGEQILRAGTALGRKIDPEAQIVAVVETGNLHAKEVIINTGGKEVGGTTSCNITTPEGTPAQMQIFDITHI